MSLKFGMVSLISWLFLAYFVILFAERLQSLVRIGKAGLFASGFDTYVNSVTVLSLTATVILLAVGNGDFWRSLVSPAVVPDYSMLTITAGVILVSGMVHTEHTIAPVQFAAYGMLIVAMILRTVQTAAGAEKPFMWWYSLVYLTAFSMAIPVMYRTKIRRATLFHVIEAVTALVLVGCFTYLLRELFLGNGADLLAWLPMAVAAVGDAVILLMRRKETLNTFVLIFVIVSAVLFCVGRIIFSI